MASRQPVLDFAGLVTSIQEADARLAAQAIRVVNFGLTLRNWAIGFYIAEFELRGADRSAYGDRLLTELSKALVARQISNTGRRQLYQYLSFYRAYPQIVRTLPAQFRRLLPGLSPSRKVRTASAPFALAPDKLFGSLSYSHFELLVHAQGPLAGRIRARRSAESTLCLEVPARTAEPRADPAVPRCPDTRGERCLSGLNCYFLGNRDLGCQNGVT